MLLTRLFPIAALVLLMTLPATALRPPAPTAGELQLAIKNLRSVGRVLYVAAHPDDENTRLLTWLSQGRGLDTTYLSITRGDGGQNLIGPELSELFGVIRTQELLAARRLDGARQLFTRARDFGYSKSPEETLAIWGREGALADVVWAIRRTRPDVIITRFDDKGRNHGHHTASAILAFEAFEAAADPARFPEQLAHVKPWQAHRIVRNVSTWRMKKGADMSAYQTLSVGGFEPLLGAEYGELAAASRSMHKSQGFGSSPGRGKRNEHFEHRGGAAGGPLDGLDLTWARVGLPKVDSMLAQVGAEFDPQVPSRSVPGLVAVHKALASSDDPLVAQERAALQAIIEGCLGLYFEVDAPVQWAAAGESVEVRVTAIARGQVNVLLDQVVMADVPLAGGLLLPNEPLEKKLPLVVPRSATPTTPYWLLEPADGGLYRAPVTLRGDPESAPAFEASFRWAVEGVQFTTRRPLVYWWTDRVQGQRYRRFEVVPPVMASPDRQAITVAPGGSQTLAVRLTGGAETTSGTLVPVPPAGWKVSPESAPFDLKRGQARTVRFALKAPAKGTPPGTLTLKIDAGGVWPAQRLVEIDYPHIPVQTLLLPASVRVVPLSLKRGKTRRVGYIEGAGDRVAEGLRQVGYDVTTLTQEMLETGQYQSLDAIVIGVRAFNKHPWLFAVLPALHSWVKDGGTLLAQYNTNSRWSTLPTSLGPLPFEIGRGRVTDESAPMERVLPKHSALNRPNKLTAADFEGWVQERGLYFAKTWDPAYRAPLQSADVGAKAERGGLLVAEHGKGHFVYAGLAFFRQLPAGVPGAYRLLANLLAL
ncbi:MAG: LmbE family N-acetylglucosaminyl deacetylase [Myxococcota bacterium]|jgi:LmbE family N-acetylglucosaminyl deacetylase